MALAPAGHQARRWEPKRLRHRLLAIAARLAVSDRRRARHLSRSAPWTHVVLTGLSRLKAFAIPG